MNYYTSDLHLFHKNAALSEHFGRNFSSVEEMNETLIENWNKVVTKKDTVYVVGDVSFGNREQTEKHFNKLNGNKILVIGNHDSNHTKRLNWKSISQYMRVNASPDVFWLCHYPTKSWDKSYHNSFHICGHVHSRGDYWFESLSCDVGVDLWNYTPVSQDTLLEWFYKLKEIKNEIGAFMWRGIPFQEIEVVSYADIENVPKKSYKYH